MLGASAILASPMRATSARASVTSVAQMAQRESERVQLVCLVTLTLIAVRLRNTHAGFGVVGRPWLWTAQR
jgi:hypothetical protein